MGYFCRVAVKAQKDLSTVALESSDSRAIFLNLSRHFYVGGLQYLQHHVPVLFLF